MSVCALLGATALFNSFVTDSSLAEAYALLVGIAACLVAGVVSGKLFRAQAEHRRRLVRGRHGRRRHPGAAGRAAGAGSVGDLPAQTVRELKDLDLYDRFVEAETHGTRDGGRS